MLGFRSEQVSVKLLFDKLYKQFSKCSGTEFLRFWILASEMQNCGETLAKHWKTQPKRRRFCPKSFTNNFPNAVVRNFCAFGSWPLKCKTAVKPLLNTRRNSQNEEDFVRKALQTIFQMQWYGIFALLDPGSEMQNCGETLAKHWKKQPKRRRFCPKSFTNNFPNAVVRTFCAFGSWPLKCKTAVKPLLNTGRNSQNEEDFVRKALQTIFQMQWYGLFALLDPGL